MITPFIASTSSYNTASIQHDRAGAAKERPHSAASVRRGQPPRRQRYPPRGCFRNSEDRNALCLLLFAYDRLLLAFHMLLLVWGANLELFSPESIEYVCLSGIYIVVVRNRLNLLNVWNSVCVRINIYIYVNIHIYIYICIERER